MNTSDKKLRRTSGSEALLFGICGGVAKFFDLDATLIRVLWAVSAFFFGSGIILYIILAFVVPKN